MIKNVNNKFIVDIQPGGRLGKRIRKLFSRLSQAKEFERRHMINIKSSEDSTLLFFELVELYWTQYASLRFSRPHISEAYRLKMLKDKIKNIPIKAVQLRHGEEFIIKRKEEGKAINTINRDINCLKRIFSWAVERSYLQSNPFTNLKHLKGSVPRVRWLNEIEIKDLLKSCDSVGDPYLKDIILIGVNTGFRRENVKDLKWEDIKGDMILAKRTKTGIPYEVPMNETLKEVLNRLEKKPHGFIVEAYNLGQRFKRVAIKAGLYEGRNDEEKVTFHTLRHTFASRYLQAGVPIYTVAKWLGHASVTMTERVYGHLCNYHHLKEIQKLKGIE